MHAPIDISGCNHVMGSIMHVHFHFAVYIYNNNYRLASSSYHPPDSFPFPIRQEKESMEVISNILAKAVNLFALC